MKKKPAAQAEDAPIKSKCPITREEFEKAKPISIKIGDHSEIAEPRTFASGSLGFYSGGKVIVEINGVPCKCQLTMSLVLVGSKDLIGFEGTDE